PPPFPTRRPSGLAFTLPCETRRPCWTRLRAGRSLPAASSALPGADSEAVLHHFLLKDTLLLANNEPNARQEQKFLRRRTSAGRCLIEKGVKTRLRRPAETRRSSRSGRSRGRLLKTKGMRRAAASPAGCALPDRESRRRAVELRARLSLAAGLVFDLLGRRPLRSQLEQQQHACAEQRAEPHDQRDRRTRELRVEQEAGDDRRDDRAAAADADREAGARSANVRRERVRKDRVEPDDTGVRAEAGGKADHRQPREVVGRATEDRDHHGRERQ